MALPSIRRAICLGILLGTLSTLPSAAQTSLHTDVHVRQVATLPDKAVVISWNPAEELFYVLTAPGDIYRFDVKDGETFNLEHLYGASDHGVPIPPEQPSAGMDIGPDGTIYMIGNENIGGGGGWPPADATHSRAVVRKGVPNGGGTHTWSTMAVTEEHRLSHTWFDHRFAGLAVDPAGEWIYFNSGSRTDHGEMYDGIREEDLTAAIFRLSTDAENVVLPNDRDALRDAGYLYADGIRNSVSLAFAPNGDLLAAENGGDRDDNEELNWIREGHHYGFPWRIGTNDTPMQFEGYDPDEDACVLRNRNDDNLADGGVWYFSNDPTYPEPPEGVTFTDPIPNYGPDADHYRDCDTGEVFSASDEGTSIGSFTSHRSPLGLVFDSDSLLTGNFRGSAFLLSWNTAEDIMLQRLDGHGEDLLMLDLDKSSGDYRMNAYRIAEGFVHPIDAGLYRNKLYVVEYGRQYGRDPRPLGIFEVTLPSDVDTHTEPQPPALALAAESFPNPFHDRVTIAYTLPRSSHVTVTLYDILGRSVAKLVDMAQPSGRHTVAFDAGSAPAGVYFARIETDDNVETVRLVRMR